MSAGADRIRATVLGVVQRQLRGRDNGSSAAAMGREPRSAYVRRQARDLLEPQDDAERDLLHALDERQLVTLTGLVSRHILGALRDGAHTGRQECLIAVAALVAEVDGPDAVDEAIEAVKAGAGR